ncbi:MAG: DNA polymerase III subunit beta [Candidatus Desulforudis sp.]|nr:DNA polymerase III subunit beta [Desulforudis sp.]
MRFQTTPENLLAGISTVQRAVAHKSPLAVLSGILFEVTENSVTLTGSNVDLTISRTVPATEAVPGRIVLPARQLAEIVRRLPEAAVFLVADPEKQSVELTYGRARARLHGYDPDDFPRPAVLQPELEFTASCAAFLDLFKRVVYAVGQDDLRPVFTGVLLEIDNMGITVVATDTHRLALNRVDFPGVADQEAKVIVSGRALSELVRILGQAEEEQFVFTIAENYVAFTVGPTMMLSRLILGNYPDYRKVIPAAYQTRVGGMDAPLLLRTVERAATLAQDGSPVVNIRLEPEMLEITAQSEMGSIREELPVEVEGQPLEASFNAKYLEEALRWCEAADLTVDFNGPIGPAIFRPVGEKDNYLGLVLPVRLF